MRRAAVIWWMLPIGPVVPVAQSLAAELPVAPVGTWQVDYADQSCVLSRTFGSGDQQVGLAFTAYPSFVGLSFVVFDQNTGAPKWEVAEITTDTLGKLKNLQAFNYRVKSSPFRITRIYVPDTTANKTFAEASQVTLIVKNKVRAALATGKLTSAFAALDACKSDLFKKWSIDRQKVVFAGPFRSSETDQLAGRLIRNIEVQSGWFKAEDFPLKVVFTGNETEISALWRIGLDRKANGCFIIESSGNPELDQETCKLITKRAVYSKIVDENGKSASGWDWTRIKWAKLR